MIQGSASTNILGISDGTTTGGVFVNNGSAGAAFQLGTFTNHVVGFITNNGTPSMTINTNGSPSVGTYANTSTYVTGPANGLAVSGNVGIGTTSPSQSLDVNGSGIFEGSSLTVGNGTGAPSLIVNAGNSGSSNGPSITLANNGSYTYQMGQYSAIYGGAYDSRFVFYTGGNSIIMPAALGVGSSNTPTSTLSVTGTANFTGNVGIGTTGPQTTLDVRGPAWISNNWGGTYPTFGATMGGGGTAFGWNGGAAIDGRSDLINFAGSGSGGFNFVLANSAGTVVSTPMTIKGNGNVGVGTTSPLSMLHVNGGAIFSTAQSNLAAVTNINFLTGNAQSSANSTNNAGFNICGLQSGGAYVLVLTAQPNGSVPTFTPYSDAACSVPITNFDSGGASMAVSSATTMYTFVRIGNTVYATVATGFTH